jgi:hypothetical protein
MLKNECKVAPSRRPLHACMHCVSLEGKVAGECAAKDFCQLLLLLDCVRWPVLGFSSRENLRPIAIEYAGPHVIIEWWSGDLGPTHEPFRLLSSLIIFRFSLLDCDPFGKPNARWTSSWTRVFSSLCVLFVYTPSPNGWRENGPRKKKNPRNWNKQVRILLMNMLTCRLTQNDKYVTKQNQLYFGSTCLSFVCSISKILIKNNSPGCTSITFLRLVFLGDFVWF